jgi:hypothetical protein
VAHILFPVLLYLLGVLLLAPAGDAIPRRFVAWTAFAWGALAWMIGALLVLILPVPYTLATIAAALVLLAGLVFFALRRRFRPTGVPPWSLRRSRRRVGSILTGARHRFHGFPVSKHCD